MLAPCERSRRARSAISASSVVIMPPSPVDTVLRGWKLKHAMLPCDPTGRPRYVDPIAHAASSTSAMPRADASRRRSRSAASPTWCTGTMAFVRAVTRRSASAGSMFHVSRSMSAKTGVAPAYNTAFDVAMNE